MKILRLHHFTLLLFVAGIGISGCATTSGVTGTVDPMADKEKSSMIEVQNKSLAKKLNIKSFKNRVINGLLNAQVEISNDFSSTQNFQYRFSWYDAAGFEVEKEAGSWQPIVMHGGAVTTVQAVAPNPTAASYKIVLRELQ